MAKLSVILCVYNTNENYFEECLKSVYESTIKDLEVIVVDDGSTTDYSSIIEKYKKIRYFKTENQGTLKARLFGIRQATSPYVCFIDSDDTISFGYLEAGVLTLEKNKADIVLNDWAFNTEKTKYYCKKDVTMNTNFCYKEEVVLNKFIKQEGLYHSFYVLWNKVFKREILLAVCEKMESLNLSKLLFAEDVLINYFAFKLANKVCNTHMGFYFYRVHETQETSVMSNQKLKDHVDSMTLVFDIMEQDLKSINRYDDLKQYFINWKQLLCSSNYMVAKHFKNKEMYKYILEKYKDCKLKKISFFAKDTYLKQRILPNNIELIDNELKKIYYSNKYLRIFVKKNSYAFSQICEMKRVFDKKLNIVNSKKLATFIMSKEKVSFKQKILHNTFVYKTGMLLFPKGSKIRKKLKSKL